MCEDICLNNVDSFYQCTRLIYVIKVHSPQGCHHWKYDARLHLVGSDFLIQVVVNDFQHCPVVEFPKYIHIHHFLQFQNIHFVCVCVCVVSTCSAFKTQEINKLIYWKRKITVIQIHPKNMHELDIIKLSIYTWKKNENNYSLIKLQTISWFQKSVYISYIKLPTNSIYNLWTAVYSVFGINNMFLWMGDDWE